MLQENPSFRKTLLAVYFVELNSLTKKKKSIVFRQRSLSLDSVTRISARAHLNVSKLIWDHILYADTPYATAKSIHYQDCYLMQAVLK